MTRRNLASLSLLALVALATGFVLAGQVKTQLLTPSNQVARYQALVRSVQDLEATNADDRRQIAALRSQIDALESAAATKSAATQALRQQVQDLRAHAGLVAMHGPGVDVELRNGVAGPNAGGQTGYMINFQDVQDVVNLLFARGAEAIAVSGRRITPLSSFSGSQGQVVIDQGPPLSSRAPGPVSDPARVSRQPRHLGACLRLELADSTCQPDVETARGASACG